MSEINHIALAKEAGARISQVPQPRFGFFSALKSIGLVDRLKPESREQILPSEDKAIAKAFEEVREGFAPDVVLASPGLKRKFLARARQLDVHASDKAISKRLLAYRKSKQHGITLHETVRDSDAKPHNYINAAEIASVQTSYRFDCSVDDLLVDDGAAAFFVGLCEKIQPGGRHLDYVTAALYIRKTRYLKKKDIERIEKAAGEPRLRFLSTLDQLNLAKVPEGEGMFLFAEKITNDRVLYIGSGDNLRKSVAPFVHLEPFKAVANHFWNPQPENIFLKIATLHNFEGIPTRQWELKLIHDKDPLFNFPVKFTDAA